MWFKVDGAYCEARVCTTQRLPVRLQWMDSAEGQSLADRVLLLTVAGVVVVVVGGVGGDRGTVRTWACCLALTNSLDSLGGR